MRTLLGSCCILVISAEALAHAEAAFISQGVTAFKCAPDQGHTLAYPSATLAAQGKIPTVANFKVQKQRTVGNERAT